VASPRLTEGNRFPGSSGVQGETSYGNPHRANDTPRNLAGCQSGGRRHAMPSARAPTLTSIERSMPRHPLRSRPMGLYLTSPRVHPRKRERILTWTGNERNPSTNTHPVPRRPGYREHDRARGESGGRDGGECGSGVGVGGRGGVGGRRRAWAPAAGLCVGSPRVGETAHEGFYSTSFWWRKGGTVVAVLQRGKFRSTQNRKKDVCCPGPAQSKPKICTLHVEAVGGTI